ncbi:MAG TPA: hypothetical protein VGH28_23505 [Polyangiaceae bacterium]
MRFVDVALRGREIGVAHGEADLDHVVAADRAPRSVGVAEVVNVEPARRRRVLVQLGTLDACGFQVGAERARERVARLHAGEHRPGLPLATHRLEHGQ